MRGFPELSHEYEVVVTKNGDLDDITLKVEIVPGSECSEVGLTDRLLQMLRLKTGLGFNIEFCPFGTLPRYEVKAKRFKDLRHREHV